MLGDGSHSADLPRDHSARQRIYDMQAGWNFERRKMSAAELAHAVEIRFRPAQDQFCFNNLAKMRVQPAISSRLPNGWMAIQYRFNFFRKYFSASDIDDGRFAARQKQKPILVESSNVSGNKPAVAQNLFLRHPGRRVRIEKSRASDGNFTAAFFIRRQNPDIEIRHHFANGVRALQWVRGVQANQPEFDNSQTLNQRLMKALIKIPRHILRQSARR